jgi:hypothetical protein
MIDIRAAHDNPQEAIAAFHVIAREMGFIHRNDVQAEALNALKRLAAEAGVALNIREDGVIAGPVEAGPGAPPPAQDNMPAHELPDADPPAQTSAATPPKTGAKRGPKPKASEPAPALNGEVLPAEAATLTTEDVRIALTSLVAAKGMPAGRELLDKFGAKKSSEINADKIAEFVAAAKAAAA